MNFPLRAVCCSIALLALVTSVAGAGVRPPVVTIAHEVLAVDADLLQVEPEMSRLIDNLIAAASLRVSRLGFSGRAFDSLTAVTTLRAIDSVLIEHRFLYPEDLEAKWTTDLTEGLTPVVMSLDQFCILMNQESNLRRHRHVRLGDTVYLVDCDIASLLYLGIGEALGLPLHLVDLPKHNFIRWVFPDSSYVNWETMYGQTESDRTYRTAVYSAPGIAGREEADRAMLLGTFLRTMSRTEALGYFHATCAIKLQKFGLWKEAIDRYRSAIALYPSSALATNNLAWQLATNPTASLRNGKEACEWARISLALFRDANALDTYAAALAESGRTDEAARVEDEAAGLAEGDEARSFRKRAAGYRAGLTYLQQGASPVVNE